MMRFIQSAIFSCVSLMVTGCGGGGGGGATVAPFEIPRAIGTNYSVSEDVRDHVDAINYNVNHGNAGHGVKVAFLEDGIDTTHRTLAEPVLLTPQLVFDGDADSMKEGTLAAILIGGRVMNDVYGIAYESELEFVCCTTFDHNPVRDDFLVGLEHLGLSSSSFVVNISFGAETSRVFSGIDQAKCGMINQDPDPHSSATVCAGDITFDFPSVAPISGMIGDDRTVLDLLHQACVAPDPDMAPERLCVVEAGDHGLHETGTMYGRNGGVFHLQDLLHSDNTMLTEADRVWLLNNIYERGSLMGLANQNDDFEGHLLVVAALEDEDDLADYSNGCGEVMQHCLSAPGTILFEICSVSSESPQGICAGVNPVTSSRYMEGSTSYATALVSGAAAVLKSTWPNLRADQVVTALLTSATDMTPDDGKRVDSVFGWGKLNMAAAFKAAWRLSTSARARLADTHVKAGSSIDAALATSTASFGMQDMYGRHYLHFVTSRLSSSQLDPALSFENWQHSSSALLDMDFETRMGLSGSQRGLALPDDLGLAALSGWDMGLEQCHLSCPTRRDVQVGSLVESSALAWTQRHTQVPGGRVGLVLETGLENDGGMTYTNRGLFIESGLGVGMLRLEAGMLDERATFMGSEFSGALDVRPGDSQYISASLGVPVGEHALSAGYTFGRAKSGLVANSYVTEIQDVSYDAYRLAFGGERWELGYTVPLAATKGGMRVESIGGYTGSKGDWSIVETDEGVVVLGQSSAEDWSYRTDSHWIDLGAGNRERRLGFTMAKPYGNWDMTFALEHVANSPREHFSDDEARAAVVLSLNL